LTVVCAQRQARLEEERKQQLAEQEKQVGLLSLLSARTAPSISGCRTLPLLASALSLWLLTTARICSASLRSRSSESGRMPSVKNSWCAPLASLLARHFSPPLTHRLLPCAGPSWLPDSLRDLVCSASSSSSSSSTLIGSAS
jgi:hypothetical protein